MLGGFAAVAGAGALVLGLAIVDERVRTELGLVLSGRPPTTEITSLGSQAQGLLRVTWRAIQDQDVAILRWWYFRRRARPRRVDDADVTWR